MPDLFRLRYWLLSCALHWLKTGGFDYENWCYGIDYRYCHSLFLVPCLRIVKLILDKHSSDKLAGNAQYWLGEVYYNDKVFDKAAVAFGKGYEKYKTGAKGPDCLLKLGLSMAQLGKKNEACLAFVNLPNEFPKASADIKKKAAQEAKKYNCQ